MANRKQLDNCYMQESKLVWSKDRRGLVYGVGINDADYVVTEYHRVGKAYKQVYICPKYNMWRKMLHRCYSRGFQSRNSSYVGCYVCEEWLIFSNFNSWMTTQNYLEGHELDKDLLVRGNKVYSPNNCIFVSPVVNKFITESTASRGNFLIGVYLKKSNGKFCSQCNNPITGKREHIGYFDSEIEAHCAWLTHKLQLAKKLAVLQDDPRVGEALIYRYENYER